MTEQAGGSRISRGRPVAEQPRRVVASYSSYRDAERAVDFLSDRRFPVQRVAIVGGTCRPWSRSPAAWATAGRR
jgi:hypothetical protein